MKHYKPLFFLFALATLSCNTSNTKLSNEELQLEAKKLHQKIATIDTHTDTPLAFLRPGFNFEGTNENSRTKVDLAKMEKGMLDAAFFAVFIGQGERTPEKYQEVHQYALDIFEAVHNEISRYSNRAAIATKSSDLYELKTMGKKAIYIGVENGYPIANNISILNDFYNLGARYLTLCHTRNNQICDSSTDPQGPEHNGLSNFGIEVVKELNRLGMLVDVSHISDKSFFDAIETSAVPVFASHSCARAICDNPRNLSDDMLRKLAENGGVIQICLLSDYVKQTPSNPQRDSAQLALRNKYKNFRELPPDIYKQAIEEWYYIDEKFPPVLATVSDLVDHIDHVVKTIGIDYVGIGSDFDGGGAIKGCMDASQMTNITAELLRRGYSDKDIEKIWGGNFLRVFRKVEEYAQQLPSK
ncbi:MAG TPA: membrane dipeptidase [Tenuifilaceae bacterium]|nr:membrane dipeptidase [Tenuifilaceae bacterium]HPJ46603.1 membrane dipeptidase [Tenuifilaceae bacterium]HPQ34961.1 membrane dipeptidase [Tenuifilaceae bacterium]HRX68761.1 membrane dipeptidase [Tenuifilaceae bacterium]